MSEVLNGEVLKNLSFEELLALGVNEVADVEEFKLVPVGYFVFEVTESEVKTPDEADAQPFVQVGITIQGVQELKDPAQADPVVAGETKSNFRYYGSMGIQRFKTTFKSVFSPKFIRFIINGIVYKIDFLFIKLFRFFLIEFVILI